MASAHFLTRHQAPIIALFVSFGRFGGIGLALLLQIVIARIISLEAYVIYVFGWALIYFASKFQNAGLIPLMTAFSSEASDDRTEINQSSRSSAQKGRSSKMKKLNCLVFVVGVIGTLYTNFSTEWPAFLFASILYSHFDIGCHRIFNKRHFFSAILVQNYSIPSFSLLLLFFIKDTALSESSLIILIVMTSIILAWILLQIMLKVRHLEGKLVTSETGSSLAKNKPSKSPTEKLNVNLAASLSALYIFDFSAIANLHLPNLSGRFLLDTIHLSAFYAAWRAASALGQFHQPLVLLRTLIDKNEANDSNSLMKKMGRNVIEISIVAITLIGVVIFGRLYMGLISPKIVSYWPLLIILSFPVLIRILLSRVESSLFRNLAFTKLRNAELIGIVVTIFGICIAAMIGNVYALAAAAAIGRVIPTVVIFLNSDPQTKS